MVRQIFTEEIIKVLMCNDQLAADLAWATISGLPLSLILWAFNTHVHLVFLPFCQLLPSTSNAPFSGFLSPFHFISPFYLFAFSYFYCLCCLLFLSLSSSPTHLYYPSFYFSHSFSFYCCIPSLRPTVTLAPLSPFFGGLFSPPPQSVLPHSL